MADKPFRNKRLATLIATAALLAGCNFFNPSGTGEYPKDDPDALVDQGQRALQDQDFAQAYVFFSRALSLDSSKSLAYHGLAKAELGKDGFTISKLVSLADSISNVPDSAKLNVLLGLGDTGLTNLYRPIMRVAHFYSLLRARDSAGKTDGLFPAHLISYEYTTIQGNKSYFLLIDANRDTVIQSGELAGLKMMSLISSTDASNLKLNAEQLIQQGSLDTVTGAIADSTKNNINGILTNVSNIAQDTALLNQLINNASGNLGSLGSTDPVTGQPVTDSTKNTVNQAAKDFITQLGSSTSFYLINDSLDNDGDGCINEEIFGDSTDNDGDSLIDEDGRVGLRQGTPVAGMPAMITPPDGFLHNRLQVVNGKLVVVPGNDEAQAMTWATSKGLLALYQGLRWVRWDDASVGNDTIWTRICKANNTTPDKVASLKNYLEVRTLGIVEVRKKVLALPADASRVQLGKKIVGGCWDNVH